MHDAKHDHNTQPRFVLFKKRGQSNSENRAKSAFIRNISHDLRTPLTGIIGIANILSESFKEKPERELVDSLLKASHALLNSINDVIEISKLDAKKPPICQDKFILKSLINDVITLVKPDIDEKGLQFRLNYDERIPNYVIGDRHRIYRILFSLISNAVKFTQNGYIKIDVTLTKSTAKKITLKIQVEDTGIGIPFEKQDIIFSRFSRLKPSYQGEYPGMGLGLAIAKQFIKDIKGKIHVSSQIGKGSIFTCIFPVKISLSDNCQGNSSTLQANKTGDKIVSYQTNPYDNYIESHVLHDITVKDHSKNISKPHILVVEDNKTIQLTTLHQLRKLNSQVSAASTGQQALDLFRQYQYDLILMDIGLPDKDGCEVTRIIRQYEKQHKQQCTPVIALTAHADDDKKKQCLHAGMDKIIIKPLTDQCAIELLQYCNKRNH